MKKYVFWLYIISFLYNSLLLSKTAALVVAHHDFQPREYQVTKKLLEKSGISVLTISDKPGTATTFGYQVPIQKTIAQLSPDEYDGLFFIGGPGALQYLDNPQSYNLLKEAAANEKIYGAICISPRILAKAGVLTNKKATGWNADNQLASIFRKYGVSYIHQPVVIDGNVITATDPMAAEGFARGIIKLLR